MSFETATPNRIRIARKWEIAGIWAVVVQMAAIIAAGLTEQFWIAFPAFPFAMFGARIHNLRCPNCAWTLYRIHGTAPEPYAKDQMLSPLRSKQVWRMPDACSKCGYDLHPYARAAGVK